MYLKKIIISGFKSFAERTTINLQKTHITGIIGPNGSGKSNVIDAVRWVMGEQNAKMLRGQKGTDIIFSGSEKRKALSHAEVSLVFDNSDNSPFCPIEYRHEEEISVTRRIYLDGNRDYFINQKPCRFKDITDFFISSSLGSKSYSMIQQGQVDRILQAKPEQIREIIEEAAGTTIFRNREQETAKRLENTQQNLERVADLSSEVEKQIEGLQEQVQRSKEWESCTKELKNAELTVWSHKLSEWKKLSESLSKKISDERADEAKSLSSLSQYEAQYNEMMSQLEKSDPEIKKISEDFTSTREELARSEESLNSSIKLIENGDSQIASNEDELEKEEAQYEELSTVLNDLEVEHKKLKEGSEGSHGSLEENRYQLDLVNEKETILNNKLHELRNEVRSIDKILDTNSGRVEFLKKNFQKLSKDKNEQIKRLIHLEENHSQESILIDSARIKSDKLRRDMSEAMSKRSQYEQDLEELEKQLSEQEEALKVLNDDLLYKKAEHTTLSDLKNFSDDSIEVIRKIKEKFPKENFHTLTEVISFRDNISEVPEKTLQAFEKWMERFYFTEMEELNSFLQSLQKEKLGKVQACLLQGKYQNSKIEKWVKENEAALLSDFFEISETDSIVESYLKSFVFIESETLEENVFELVALGATVFTSKGVILHALDDIHYGVQGKGLLTQKAKSKKLEEELAKIEKQTAKQENKVLSLRKKRDSADDQVKEAEKDGIEKNKLLIEATTQLKALDSQIIQKEEMIQNARDQAKLVEDEYTLLEQELTDLQESSKTLSKERKETELEIKDLRASIEELADERAELQEILSQKKIQAAASKERLQAIESNISQVQNQLANQTEKLTRKKKDLSKLKESIEVAKKSRGILESEIGRLARKREELDTLLKEKQEEHSSTRVKLKEIEQNLHIWREAQEKAKKSLSVNEMELEKARLGMTALEEQCQEKYKMELSTYELPKRIDIGELTKKMRSLKARLESFGPINMMAAQEYAELQERKAFIDQQKEEVLNSIETLEKARLEIKEHASVKFMSTFVALNKEFQDLFPILFSGGEAQLTLVGSDDPLQAGVEIIVRLPGKKPQSMTLFSGGEKALTAISLIFALLKSNPTPFCFLDEVDAPLDETNVRKYNKLLQALAGKFQFIVITHNRRTMEVFDTLFGVTMQEPGVSKVVGVDLAQSLPKHLQKSFATERPVQGATSA